MLDIVQTIASGLQVVPLVVKASDTAKLQSFENPLAVGRTF